jgi:DNA-directed RNA polymerase subunit omega
MNIELTRKALEKVGNPHILVNLVSRRVRQISSGNGGASRPLVDVPPTMDLADIALLEIIEDKIGWESTYTGATPMDAVVPKKKKSSKKSAAAAAALVSAQGASQPAVEESPAVAA